nr:21 kda soluble matrix protein {N-terminal} [Mytilus edulis=blue mussel, shells, Peptide Partial, 30 aa] [Mytilus edulis]
KHFAFFGQPSYNAFNRNKFMTDFMTTFNQI